MGRHVCWLTRCRIALIGQLGVAVERNVATAAQLHADRGLAGARHTLDQKVPQSHPLTVTGDSRTDLSSEADTPLIYRCRHARQELSWVPRTVAPTLRGVRLRGLGRAGGPHMCLRQSG